MRAHTHKRHEYPHKSWAYTHERHAYPHKSRAYTHKRHTYPHKTKSYADLTIGVAYFRSGTLINGRFRFNFDSFSFNAWIYGERFGSCLSFGNAGIRNGSSPLFGVYAILPLFMRYNTVSKPSLFTSKYKVIDLCCFAKTRFFINNKRTIIFKLYVQ